MPEAIMATDDDRDWDAELRALGYRIGERLSWHPMVEVQHGEDGIPTRATTRWFVQSSGVTLKRSELRERPAVDALIEHRNASKPVTLDERIVKRSKRISEAQIKAMQSGVAYGDNTIKAIRDLLEVAHWAPMQREWRIELNSDGRLVLALVLARLAAGKAGA